MLMHIPDIFERWILQALVAEASQYEVTDTRDVAVEVPEECKAA